MLIPRAFPSGPTGTLSGLASSSCPVLRDSIGKLARLSALGDGSSSRSTTSSGRPAPEIRLSERAGHHFPRAHHCQFGPIGMARLRQADHAAGRLDGDSEDSLRIAAWESCALCRILSYSSWRPSWSISSRLRVERRYTPRYMRSICAATSGGKRRRIRRWSAGRRAHRGLAHQFRSRRSPRLGLLFDARPLGIREADGARHAWSGRFGGGILARFFDCSLVFAHALGLQMGVVCESNAALVVVIGAQSNGGATHSRVCHWHTHRIAP